VTEEQYVDPVDGSPAQFIAASLKPNTAYIFRVRSYSTARAGRYSNLADDDGQLSAFSYARPFGA